MSANAGARRSTDGLPMLAGAVEARRTRQPVKLRPGRAGTRRVLISLMLAASIPVLLFGGSVAYFTADAARASARRDAAETLNRVAERVTFELAKEVEVAQTLSALPSLDAKDLAKFYAEAARTVETRPLWETVSLADSEGVQRLNILRPLGDSLGPVADRKSFDQVMRTGSPSIGGIGPVGPITGRRLVALGVPVLRGGEIQFVLTVAISPASVQHILREAGAPAEWVGAIVDGEGNIIARTTGEEDVGRPASEALRSAILQAPAGFYTGQTLEGTEVETVYRNLPRTDGWTVHFGVPREALDGPVYRSIGVFAAGSLASLALAGGLAHLTGRDLAQRRREEEERAELALAASEERGALAVEAAELGTWQWDPQDDEISGSERTRALLDLPNGRQEGLARHWPRHLFMAAVHEADVARVDDAMRRCLRDGAPIDVEFRVLGRNAEVRWVRAQGRVPRRLEPPDGRSSGPGSTVHGVLSDIDPRKRAEAERIELLRRLADAQEGEQRRIARELHDQVGQTVTGLSLGLKSLEQTLAGGEQPDPAAQDQVRWLQSLATEIGRDIHRAASDLRPTALDDLGLDRALATYARDWSERCGVGVDVQSFGLDERLPREVETAIYRVTQEALTNVVKHARARTVSIVLERRNDQVRVVIEDDGDGFDPKSVAERSARRNREGTPHLGLSGIRERLALIGGNLNIESAGGAGTALFIHIPLSGPKVQA